MNTGADVRYMRLAIQTARKAEGLTSPNPLVGAVVVKNGRIVGKGYHKRCGLSHAEVVAIKKAGPHTDNGTLYVSLEPCDHFGRTPPCTDTIIKSGIRRVVAAMYDPNPINNGRGISKLKKHGIKTAVGILEDEARSINLPYIKYITKKMPYVTVKIAESIDGKIATKTGDSRWITGDDSRRYVHRMRNAVDAVMVGINTVLADDPMLVRRGPGKKQPARIVVDSHLRLPLGAKLFSNIPESPLIIATTKQGRRRIKLYEKKGARVLVIRSKKRRVDLRDLMKTLAKMAMVHILIEGGGELAWSLVSEHLVDKFLFFIAPKIIGGKAAISSIAGDGVEKIADAIGLKNLKIRRFDKDVLIETEVA